ncbi:hypothetical protein GGQ99_002921 [Aminobacter niigataensis]|uniref:Uncharacterized protein n=1 Tax=Aminobacter niigataensis TaxID=83265 RepID=A0ABR6L334_9HYPH|nr:hypothetical protein [Aminobacter niigataensis]
MPGHRRIRRGTVPSTYQSLTLTIGREAGCLRHPRAEQERSDVRRPGDPCRDAAVAAAVQNGMAHQAQTVTICNHSAWHQTAGESAGAGLAGGRISCWVMSPQGGESRLSGTRTPGGAEARDLPSPPVGEGGLARSAKTDEGCWKKREFGEMGALGGNSETPHSVQHPSSAPAGHLLPQGEKANAFPRPKPYGTSGA